MQKIQKTWYVYIINASDNTLYTGITTNIKRRWEEHSNSSKGAKYFRGRKPRELLYVEIHMDRSTASKKENHIKRMDRANKLLLIKSDINQIKFYLQN